MSPHIRSLLIVVTVALVAISSGVPTRQYANCKWLSGSPVMYRVWWTVDAASTPKMLQLAIEANSTGWVGLGLSTDGTMAGSGLGSDMFIAYMTGSQNGTLTPFLGDYWATQKTFPTLDTIQNLAHVSSSREGTYSTFEFDRALDTGDDNQDIAIDTDESDLYFVWATHPTEVPSSTSMMKHLYKGAAKINWLGPSTCPATPPAQSVDGIYGNKWASEDGDFVLQWAFLDATSEIEFSMAAKTDGWVGVGFSDSPSMINSDVVVGWIDDETNNVTLVDLWIGALRIIPKLDTSFSNGSSDITLVAASNDEDTTTFVFRRKLITSDPYDMSIINRNMFLIWAFGNDHGEIDEEGVPIFGIHKKDGVININLFSGVENVTFRIDESAPHTTLRTSHGMIMIIAWPLLIVAGSFGARYIKPITLMWWPMHYVLQGIGSFLSVLAVLLVAIDIGTDGEHFNTLHSIIGAFVMLGMIAQAALGWHANAKFEPKREQAPFFPDRIHWYLGRGLMVAAVLNILIGLYRYRMVGYNRSFDVLLPEYKTIGMFIVVVYTFWLILAISAHAFGEWTRKKAEATGAKVTAPFALGVASDSVVTDTAQVELDENHPDEEHDPPIPLPTVTLEAQEAGIKVIPTASSKKLVAPDVPLTTQMIAFGKKNRLFSAFVISHIIMLLSIAVALSLVPNDEDVLPSQSCPSCVVAAPISAPST